MSLIESGKSVPFGTNELLKMADLIIDEGPLVERLLRSSGEDTGVESAVPIIGPKTISQLIDQIFRIHGKIRENNGRYDKALSDEYYKLCGWISKTKAASFIQSVLEHAATEKPDEIALLADLISRHGGSVKRQSFGLDATAYDLATATILRWAQTLLASPEATRAQFAEIAQAAERLESPALVPVLQELLSEDLERRKRAMKEFLDARKNGRHIQNDAQMSWTLQYGRAFAAIGDDQTIRIMKDYLPNHDFGLDAAHVLKAIWIKSQNGTEDNALIRPWPDFSVVPNQYTRRQSGAEVEMHPFVDDILAVVDDLIKSDAQDADYRHALKLATVAFSMPYVDKADMIRSLLQLPLSPIEKQGLLNILVLSGEVVSSEVVLKGIDELLEKAKTNPWMLEEQDGWRLDAWLRLLPFTELPASILDVLASFEDRYLVPWRLRGLLSALSYAPYVEAENVLSELAKRDERFLSEYEWLSALSKRNTLTAARILLDLVCNASFSGAHGSYDRMDFGNRLSALMNSYEQFRQEVYERFQRVAASHAKSILEEAIANAADTNGVLLLVRVGAAQGKQFRGTALYTALRHVLVGQITIGTSGMQQLYSLPALELRKGLFEMVVNGNTAESRLATECLAVIDGIRDDYGHVESEPRHPNIALGVPWPRIVPAEPI